MRNRFSIITISFNNESDIEATILSVINQSFSNFQYILIDGGSTDNTPNIIERYRDQIDYYLSEPDDGIYEAINKGLQAATGEIVGLIHAGDRLHDKAVLKDIDDHFAEHDIDASYGHSVIVNSEGNVVRVNKSPVFKKTLFKVGWMPSHQSIYIRKEIIDELGLYRLDLGGSGDYEFVLRYFYFNTIKVKRIDRYIIRFALGGTSTSNYHRILRTQRTHIKCWELNGVKPPFYMVPMKLARKIPQFVRAMRGKY